MDRSSADSASKFLSYVLRHEPASIGIRLDQAGWVQVRELLAALAASGRALSRAELETLVHDSDKQRFALSADGERIRANQGHSVEVELGYEPVDPPALLYHGTVARYIEAIRAEGLVRGQRHHVHLSATRELAEVVGMRRGRAIVLEVRAREMVEAGHGFFRTVNGVWLTEHVPPSFLR